MKKNNNLFQPELMNEALKQSFIKLNPAKMILNPVMFMVWVGTLVMTGVCVWIALGEGNQGSLVYNLIVTFVLFLTLLFANFAEAIAEARGKAQADSLRKTREETPAKWDDLWNPEYKGHVLLLNDCREVFSVALKKHGWSNNSTDPAQAEAAFKDLKQLNSSVIAYDTENLKQKFIAEEGWIGIMWSGDAAFTYRENNNVGFVVPDQGSLIWSDNFAIPKGCKNKELAEKFMNYMYDPKVSAKNWEFMNCANPNDEALKYHSQAYLDDPMLKIGKESIPKGEWLTDIGDSITMYDRYWTELKAGQ